jgi:polysaccharide export outer membrane protein
VLRSELQPRLTAHLKNYLRDPVVIVRPLLRIGILGNVLHPGYYYTSADLPLTDVLMVAGGPTPDADLTKVSVRRGTEVIMNDRKTRSALTAGRSLDNLHMQAGDEVQVGKRRELNWGVIVPSVSALLGLVIALSQ